jgi:prepilin signal peptidase PulO-like enzyme (type II secretory pathway)
VYAFWLVFVVAIGAVVGSFLNVCIVRLPFQKSIVWPGSHCMKCLQPVRASDNIPILSWFLLRGRCRHCGEPFSARYMLIEALTAALFGWLYYELPPHDWPSVWRLLYFAILFAGLIAATFIDFDFYEIPDSITVPLMIVGLGTAAIWPTDWPPLQLHAIVSVLPSLTRVGSNDWPLYFAGVGGGLLMLATWTAWLRSRRRFGLVGPAEWIIMAVWGAYLILHIAVIMLAWQDGQIPTWLRGVAAWRGFWTSVVGFLAGAAVIWFVRLIAFGVLNCKRRSVARIAVRWRAAHPVASRRRQRRRKDRATERPGYFYAWNLIFAGAGRINQWKRLGPWIAKEGMGFGDVTLMAAIGAFLGWQPTLLVFLLAPFVALVLNLVQAILHGTRQIPFGPYLSIAVVIVVLFWDVLWPRLAAWGGALIFLLQLLTEGAGNIDFSGQVN